MQVCCEVVSETIFADNELTDYNPNPRAFMKQVYVLRSYSFESHLFPGPDHSQL